MVWIVSVSLPLHCHFQLNLSLAVFQLSFLPQLDVAAQADGTLVPVSAAFLWTGLSTPVSSRHYEPLAYHRPVTDRRSSKHCEEK